jgi:hypothetical protein
VRTTDGAAVAGHPTTFDVIAVQRQSQEAASSSAAAQERYRLGSGTVLEVSTP